MKPDFLRLTNLAFKERMLHDMLDTQNVDDKSKKKIYCMYSKVSVLISLKEDVLFKV